MNIDQMNLDFLTQVLEQTTEELSESEFVNRYLPILINGTADDFNKVWLNEVVTSPYLSVSLKDKSGKIVCVVPPLRKAAQTSNTNDFNNALSLADAETQIAAIRGIRIFENVLLPLAKIESIRDIEHIEGWRHILIRYGYGHLIKTEVDITTSIQNGDDFLSGDIE